MDNSGDKIEDRATRTFERVVTITERVGIPVATFAMGALTLGISTQFAEIPQLPWLGTILMLASLVTYVWLTARSTIKVQPPPAPIPIELKELIDWMKEEISKQNEWKRSHEAEKQ